MYTLTKFVNSNKKNPDFFVWNLWDENDNIIGQSVSYTVKGLREDINRVEEIHSKKVSKIEANAKDDNIIETYEL
jgi:hypothetical protein